MGSLKRNSSCSSYLSNCPFQFAGGTHLRGRLTALFVVICAALATTNAAADYPDRPVRVPSAPGGGVDVINRIIATELTRQLGKQFVADNRPGASGVIGTEMIARAAPDGYSIGSGILSTLVTNRSMLSKLPYDFDRDIQPVAQYAVGSPRRDSNPRITSSPAGCTNRRIS